MKKLLFAVAACSLIFASCNSSDNSSDNQSATPKSYSEQQKADGDSIALILGKLSGTQDKLDLNRLFTQYPDNKKNFDQDEYFKAFELVLTTDTANVGFLLGLQNALQVYGAPKYFTDQFDAPVDPQKLIAAYKDAFDRENVDYEVLMNYQAETNKFFEGLNNKKAEREEAAAQQLIQDRLAEGYKKTDSGLVYKINNAGDGVHPTLEDNVNVSYKGMHVNGSVFDESINGIDFPLGGVVPGFAEALTMLGEGGSGTFILPAELAYGQNGVSNTIAPNETLIFEITLNKINSAAANSKASDITSQLEAEVAGSES